MITEKSLHPRNIHNGEYDFKKLTASYPSLSMFVSENQYNNLSIDFSDPKAVLALNQALLFHEYKVSHWTIPNGHLCPAIPGRADYVHYIADLLTNESQSLPSGANVKGLDIGTGIGCIYPVLANSIYGWKFVATDVNSASINHCRELLELNPNLKKKIKLRFQKSVDNIFINIIKPGEKFDFTMCNPPFHSSLLEAKNATALKTRKLNANKEKKGHDQNKLLEAKASNFGGKNYELWYPGGEVTFVNKMIQESLKYKDQCRWFTTLVSNKKTLTSFRQQLQKISCSNIQIIEMNHGKKIVHILAWSFI